MTELIKNTTDAFVNRFGTQPDAIYMSPGRINIIGEHVDYNDGFVLPAAIDKYICFAISLTNAETSTIVAKDVRDDCVFNIHHEIKPVEKHWMNYILGVLHQYQSLGTLKNFNAVFSSTIPNGAGLSSSAALECGIAFALNDMLDLKLSKKEIALVAQRSEHTFVGVMCGIMDQFSSVFGKENKVIKLDCTTLDYEYHNADFGKYSLVLLNSKVKHSLLTSQYNVRRQECQQGLEIIKRHYQEVKTFRDCTAAQVEAVRLQLGETIYKRCHFVVAEIQRVVDAVKALESHDFKALGHLMYETHCGLSQDYQVSCDELDFLVDAAKNETAVLGARMMGGGFGGCSINLVETAREDEVINNIAVGYKKAFNIALKPYKVKISKGTFLYTP